MANGSLRVHLPAVLERVKLPQGSVLFMVSSGQSLTENKWKRRVKVFLFFFFFKHLLNQIAIKDNQQNYEACLLRHHAQLESCMPTEIIRLLHCTRFCLILSLNPISGPPDSTLSNLYSSPINTLCLFKRGWQMNGWQIVEHDIFYFKTTWNNGKNFFFSFSISQSKISETWSKLGFISSPKISLNEGTRIIIGGSKLRLILAWVVF